MTDNWGHIARIGIFVAGAEAVPEAEWWAMAPPGVSIHAARVTAKAPWATWDERGADVVLAPDIVRGAAQFAALRASAAVVAHTSSGVLGGDGWDEAVKTRLARELGPGVQVSTNGVDCVRALNALGVSRPFIVLPPWFDEAFATLAAAYFERRGPKTIGHMIHEPDPKWRGVAPSDLYARFMHVEQRIDLLRDQILARCPASADGVLIPGTGFRCVGIIDDLETALGRPVVTANQASLWATLDALGARTPVRGYGRLLELENPSVIPRPSKDD